MYQFIACTNDKTQEVLDAQIDLINTDPRSDFAVLTLGGNDIGFLDIIKACLLKLGGPTSADYDETVADSRTKTVSQDLQDNLFMVYYGIFDKMLENYHYQIFYVL